jgi:hypothetical protein
LRSRSVRTAQWPDVTPDLTQTAEWLAPDAMGQRLAGCCRARAATVARISDAAVFVDSVTTELARGSAPALAVARVRAEKIRADPTSWVRHVVVFQ